MLVMKNIAGCSKYQIRRKYDMKGSTDGRKVLDDQKEDTLVIEPGIVYKDLDFIKLEEKLDLTLNQGRRLKEQL